ncbi:hypothetical protein [Taibaiella koreensis]|nr:hypothetical protein [Taibaiella koreensis]
MNIAFDENAAAKLWLVYGSSSYFHYDKWEDDLSKAVLLYA